MNQSHSVLILKHNLQNVLKLSTIQQMIYDVLTNKGARCLAGMLSSYDNDTFIIFVISLYFFKFQIVQDWDFDFFYENLID